MTKKKHTQDNTYKVGGTIPPNDPIYVNRKADEELYKCLKDREFCCVFNSRQMGKSSLVVGCLKQLETEGKGNFQSVIIDLSRIGSEGTQEQWYYSIIKTLSDNFGLDISPNWWEERKKQTYSYTLGELFEGLLNNCQDNILIAIDEIDSIISLKFPTNDFFAFIRSCYNKRANDPKYNRLTFCLLGVVTPSDLISDESRTPFNIGKAIELRGFTLEEAKQGLKKGLREKVDNPDHILAKILEWTNGQPFLTQKLCSLVVEQGHKNPDIDHLVNTKIIDNWEANDRPEHLKTLRDRILWDDEELGIRLKLYREILKAEESGIEASNTLAEEKLCLSGLVIRTDVRLRFSNKICQTIFNLNWVQAEIDKLRPYPKEYVKQWQQSQEESWLLTGQDLQKALNWKKQMGVYLSKENQDFIEASQLAALTKETKLQSVILAMREKLIGKTKNTVRIANEILKLTNSDIQLTTVICESINPDNTQSEIAEGDEEKWLETQIKKQIIEHWENHKPLQKIGDILLHDNSALDRLTAYQQILQGKVPDNENALNALLVSKLIVKNEEKLQVANCIYEQVFSLEWVKDQLWLIPLKSKVSELKGLSEDDKSKTLKYLKPLKILEDSFELVDKVLLTTEGKPILVENMVNLLFEDINIFKNLIPQYKNIKELITQLGKLAESATIFLSDIEANCLLWINDGQEYNRQQLDFLQFLLSNNIKNYANKAQEYNQEFEVKEMQLLLKDKVIYSYRLLPNIMLIMTGIQRVEIETVRKIISRFLG